MPITFYTGYGSPYAWKVWLALGHKRIPHDTRLLSLRQGDTRKPAFLALNPRGRVPVIVDASFVLSESSAIVEYLEERYPERPLLPDEFTARANLRRLAGEADCFLYPSVRRVFEAVSAQDEGDADPAILPSAREDLAAEIGRFDAALSGDYFGGSGISLADCAIYPSLGLLRRADRRQPEARASQVITDKLDAWMKRIESQTYFETTLPPHWRA